MRGGKRQGAGRRKGPQKIRLVVYVLAATWKILAARALHAPSLGAVLDDLLRGTEDASKK